MSSLSITERAAAVLKAEAAARLAAEQATQAASAAAAAERERLEREARIIAAAERQQALLRAERLEAEQAAAARLVAEQAALAAEVERLRARSPLEILQDEMAEMKRQMAAAARPPEPEALHLRERVMQLDALYKSSQEEIAALKSLVDALIGHCASRRGCSIRNGDERSLLLKEYIKLQYGDGTGVDGIYMA